MAQHLETAAPPAPAPGHVEQPGRRLGSFLCWAVVFADIGTSVYYVPGILYGDPKHGVGVGDLAGLFVTMTMVVFVLLAIKYAEVSVRFPEGGGVVSVAARGINPWVGAVGGMFILTSYFLTSAISSLSGVQYFETLVPVLGNLSVQLIVTVILVGLLGLLNWYGIKESAVVSAGIAVAAFIGDLVILGLIVFRVPVNVIGQVFADMFSGQHLTTPLLITGYAGAFLAFSGLESISQLAPVMALPRNKTVSRALALVVLTVGITSPLLTIFSTTLLTRPELLAQTSLLAPHVTNLQSLQNQFISQLGYSVGGRLLEIFTAITASTLLLFASNTAIIGAYHVFLALSKMQFFPTIIERKDRRGSPYVAILLATALPMLVLVAVSGRIDLLGDMYAFGLLGAFSLTCFALDVIRWRERHGARPVGTQAEHDMVASEPPGKARRETITAQLSSYVRGRMSPQMAARFGTARSRLATTRSVALGIASPHIVRISRLWPDTRYFLGFLTTILVGSAWLINLWAKPLATGFGGGLAVLGVAISVINYRSQQSRGQAIVQPTYFLRPMPRSRLVVLDPRSTHNATVVRAACQAAQGHPLLILCLGYPQVQEVRTFAINDAYLNDPAALATLRLASRICASEHVEVTYIYRVARPNAVLDAWRVIQPDEIIAEASVAKEFAKKVTPDYVRKQQVDDTTIVHAIRRRVSPLEEEPAASQATGAYARAGGRGRPAPTAAARGIENGARGGEAGEARAAPTAGAGAAREEPRPAERRPVTYEAAGAPPAAHEEATPAPAEEAQAEAPQTPEAVEVPPQTGPLPPNVNLEEYVWTGTDLVRKGELEGETAGDTAGESAGEAGQGPAAPDAERHAPDEPSPANNGE